MLTNWKDNHHWKQSWCRIKRNPLTITGFLTVGLFVVVAVFAPVLAPYPDHAKGLVVDMATRHQPPSWEHLLGTNHLGRDILSEVIFGTRLSLSLGLLIVALTAATGILMGIIAGYYGRWVDEVIMRVGDILMSIPSLLVAIALVMAMGAGPGMLVVAVSLPWWPNYSRIVRGVVLQIKELDYVTAARAQGASTWRIIFKHILPNTMNVMIIRISGQIGRAIMVVGMMGFLGVGIRPPLVELGLMVSIGRMYILSSWWMAFFPAVVISLLVMGFNFLGDGIRDFLDPRNVN
jgi:peptide/nickel transport system permease protein